MSTMRLRACAVCGNEHARPLFHNAMAALDGLDLSYRVGDCTNCGFSYAYELPNDTTYQRYYRTLSKYDVSATVSESDHLRFDAIVRLVKARLELEATVVDIGCGEGALLSKLKAAGYQNLYGVDPAPHAPVIAQKKYGLQTVRTCFLDNAGSVVPLASANGVCIAAVLEHLPNLRSDLQQLLAQLKPNCSVVIEVPALELFGTGQGEPYGEFSQEHVNYFCRDTLSQLMASLGWKCQHSEYLAYPQLLSGSVLSVFSQSAEQLAPLTNAVPRLQHYVAAGDAQVWALLERVPAGNIIVWGAGSHSARILPLLKSVPGLQVRALVDSNPNLTGKNLGGIRIQSPDVLASLPALPVVVSSFRAQNEIAERLRQCYSNPLVLLYP